MDIKQVKDSLDKIFKEESKRIVFWYDEEREFEEIIPSLDLNGINIIRLDETGPLELKIKLELEDTEGQYIVYAPYREPDPEEDWLLDIRLFNYTFYADSASLLLSELNLKNQSMRSYLKERQSFFRSQDRLKRLQKWVMPDDREDDIDLKMLAILVRAEHPEFFSILMELFDAFCNEGSFNPNDKPKEWEEIEKHGLEQPFWKLIVRTFGYTSDSPKLSDLIIRLLVTDFSINSKGKLPTSLEHFLIQSGSHRLNVSVFLSQWRTNMEYCESYKLISDYYSKELRIEEPLQQMDIYELLDVMTFEMVERKIIKGLRDRIVEGDEGNKSDELKAIIQRRSDGHWAGKILGGTKKDNLYQRTYQALDTAIELFRLRRKYDSGFSFPSAEAMFNRYVSELYLFDQYYRKFHENADRVELGGWDVLKRLQDAIEDCYSGWFIDQIALTWGSFIDQGKDGGLIKSWYLPEIKQQYSFYQNYVKDALRSASRNRIFVIISDGLRYEAAEELTREINGKYRFSAKLEPMLGVLPSYTALGMAALLPHETITYKGNSSDEILIDHIPTSAHEQRIEILKRNKGTAIRADELVEMNKDEGRDFVRPHQVIYIYHNQIDATGDKAVTESDTFDAVRKAIDELIALTNLIINRLNGSYVLISADHGFIYQDESPEHIDKSVLDTKPSGAIVAKKRYIIGRNLGESSKVWHGSTKITARTQDDMEFWIPKGVNRFHLVGGSRYFHGGAMLQEIVVPVITVQEVSGKDLEKSEVRKVGVSLLGSNRKVVTNIHRFEFIQTDSVSEKVKPSVIQVSIRDGNALVSNEETVTFDSSSSSMDERKKSVKLMLKSGNFDNKKEYYLVLRYAETQIEYDRIPITIDLAFTRDF